MLLLTNDNELEDLVADALSGIGGISHLTRDAGDALEIICGVYDLDLAIIDFEHGTSRNDAAQRDQGCFAEIFLLL